MRIVRGASINVRNLMFTDEEVFFEHNNSSPEDEEFDAIVGALEEILQDDAFQTQLNSFYVNNCGNCNLSRFICNITIIHISPNSS